MPANLSPEYLAAEQSFKEASTPAEKVLALEEMLRTIPKHKGTEKMQADIKRRLSRLRKESQKKKQPAAQKPFYHIEREGAGQVIICGPPNSGKSQLLQSLTHAQPDVANYPFTTRLPQPGMMFYEDIQIQLVDTPPLAPEIFEPWQLAMVRQADAALLLFDVNDPNLLEQTEYILTIFGERGIALNDETRPAIVAFGTKVDHAQGQGNFSAWQELYQDRIRARPTNLLEGKDIEAITQTAFGLLRIVRVYTKAPGKKPEENPTPYVLKRGSTILDVATMVHHDLATNFKFARVWGKTRFDGQMVERTYIVQDKDLVEIHTG